MHQLLERFKALFHGYEKAFGVYTVAGPDKDNPAKMTGPRETVTGTITDRDWEGHLNGSGRGLGIIMLLTDDTVRFAAIDVDNYHMDLPALEKRVLALSIPMLLCRTKSGGAHLYLFLAEALPAEYVRTKLSEWVAALNLSNSTEVFPKQSMRAGPTDVGSWINIPYYNSARTLRYCIRNGNPLDLEQFLDLAESNRVTREQMDEHTSEHVSEAAAENSDNDPLYEAPPCLVQIQQRGGFPSGTRNDGMLAVGVYIKKRFPTTWQDKLNQYNELFCRPPLSTDELSSMLRGLARKDYFYRCKQQPIASACQAKLCARRTYGVSGGASPDDLGQVEALAVTGLSFYSHPGESASGLWGIEIGGKRVMVPSRTLFSPRDLLVVLAETHNYAPGALAKLSPAKWTAYLEGPVSKADRFDLTTVSGANSVLWESIIDTLRSMRRVSTHDEFINNPRVAHQSQRVLSFHFQALRRFLGRQPKIEDQQIVSALMANGAKLQKEQGVEYWKIENKLVLNDSMVVMPEKMPI